jgi:hypothetical protein
MKHKGIIFVRDPLIVERIQNFVGPAYAVPVTD